MSDKWNRETCREYAHENIGELSQSVKDHYAFRYLHIHPLVEEMGGWANYRAFVCDKRYMDTINELQKENSELKDLAFYFAEQAGLKEFVQDKDFHDKCVRFINKYKKQKEKK